MARSIETHLSSEEIEQVLASEESWGEPAPVLSSPAEIEQHLAICEACRGRVQMYKSEDEKLARLKAPRQGVRGPQCPPDADRLRVATGLTQPAETEGFLRHAADCDYCGPLLRRALEEMSPNIDQTEAAALGKLKSGQPAWQQRLAARMSATAQPAGAKELSQKPGWTALWPAWPRWAFAAAAGVIVIVAGWSVLQRRHAATPEQLLAEAYTEQRTLELRLPGARYAPLRQERGGERSRLSRPTELLEAEAEISRGLATHPTDPALLQAKARADLLEWNYEAAIQSLKRAQETNQDSPALLVDLASAYFERAEAEDRAIDYGTVIELLGKALDKQPDDPVALFNRAIAFERMFMFQQAAVEWEHYLRVDSTNAWAGEARHRLSVVKDQLSRHQKGVLNLSTDPAAFVNAVRQDREGNIDSEQYLDTAMTQWLPGISSTEISNQGPRSPGNLRRALALLAGMLVKQHKDLWLSELLAAPPSEILSSGIRALAEAVKADNEGKPTEGKLQAEKAERLFSEAGSHAGIARATLEEIYARHRSQEGLQCVALANRLTDHVIGTSFTWIAAQLELEKSICMAMTGNVGEGHRSAELALKASESAGYRILYLRCLGIVASLEMDLGKQASAWSRDRAGLGQYWSGSYPNMRAYQFYNDMVTFAEEESEWRLAVPLAREAVSAIEPTGNRSGEAMARYYLAYLEVMAGVPSEASDQFEKANRLFSSLDQDPVIGIYRLNGEIALAEIEAKGGDTDQAMARLLHLQPELPGIANYLIALKYYQVWGAILLSKGKFVEAERALSSAISISEVAAKSLDTDRDRLTWVEMTSKTYKELVEIQLVSRHNVRGGLELWEWYRGAPLRSLGNRDHTVLRRINGDTRLEVEFDRLRAAPALPQLTQVQRLLPLLVNSTVLSYAQLPQGLVVWVFDNRGIQEHYIDSDRGELERVTNRFRMECADPGSDIDALKQDGRQLYRWLVEPVEGFLADGRSLIVEPDGAVARIPFQALVNEEGRYLGVRQGIVWSPGIYYNLTLRAGDTISKNQTALVVGSPATTDQFASAFAPLPDAMREAQDISAQFKKAILLTGREATFANVSRELSKAEVFHFAGHSVARTNKNGLLLAPEDSASNQETNIPALLEVSSLSAMQIHRCVLAVFSACPTGGVEADDLVDPENLVRGFLRGGVPHLIASRWDVDSGTTLTFMKDFYSALLSGTPVSGAMQVAVRAVQSNPKSSHPYYWAAFSLFGKL